jgi:hypothetical protein
MSRNKKPTPEDLLELLEDHAADDEAERILALSGEDLDAELKAEGFDPEQVRRKGIEIGGRMSRLAVAGESRAEGAGWVSIRPAQTRVSPGGLRWASLLAPAALACVVMATLPIVVARLSKPQEVATRTDASPNATGSAAPSPQQLRERALAACDAHLWQACINGLNAARDQDPEGDKAERVQAAWRTAIDILRIDPAEQAKPLRPSEGKP